MNDSINTNPDAVISCDALGMVYAEGKLRTPVLLSRTGSITFSTAVNSGSRWWNW